MEQEALARRLYEVAHLEGEFVLRTGQVISEYFDKYQFESDPSLLGAVSSHLSALVPPGAELLAGVELGGIPLVTALSLRTGLPAVFVHKQVKEYGTRRLVEGPKVSGKRLVVVDDIISSGAQVIESTCALVEQGAEILGLVCVIERLHGAREKIESNGWPLRALFTEPRLKALANGAREVSALGV